MGMPQKIKDIQKSIEDEKEIKRKYDATFDLSNAKNGGKNRIVFNLDAQFTADKTIRLLDEGAILWGNADGSDPENDIRLFLMKDTILNWYKGLSGDYVGMIKFSHMDFESFPVKLGSWQKKDLSLVVNEDGRNGLDIRMTLDSEKRNPFVQYLKNLDIPFGVSVEMENIIDWEQTEEKGFPVIKWLNITDFAIVGAGANTASNGITLSNSKGGKKMTLEEIKNIFLNKKEKLENQEEVEEKNEVEEEIEEVETTDTVEAVSTEEFSEILEVASEYIQTLETKNVELEKALSDRKIIEDKLSKLSALAGKNVKDKLGKKETPKAPVDPING